MEGEAICGYKAPDCTWKGSLLDYKKYIKP